MSKFGKKLIIWLTIIIVVLGGVSLSMTTSGLERYYLGIKKLELHKIYEEMRRLPITTIYQNAHSLGKAHEILLITLPWTENQDTLNQQLKDAFTEHGVFIQKLWLWEEDAKKLEDGEVVNQIYNQGSSGYSLFIKYYVTDHTLVVMSRTIPHIDDILNIISLFIMAVWIIALLIIVLCVIVYIRRMTKPLLAMEHLIKEITQLKFGQIHIETSDELESLANGINEMSHHLQVSHQQLEQKNIQMKELLSNVSHELKTPISLIKAYGIAIEDGMDDGTFLSTILEQNQVMEDTVSQLLMLAKKEQQLSNLTPIDLIPIIEHSLKDYKVYSTDLDIKRHLEDVPLVQADYESISCAIGNLISNAIKYTANGMIEINCYEKESNVHVEVRNGISEKGKAAIEHLWEPFYVVEQSRNKALCGTGLGLYMTRKLLQKLDVPHGCFLDSDTIVFYMICNVAVLEGIK
ncbi:MAG: histidine kinase dimerization/phospho-acceptor domain-containing protein [Cellulosilyticaceae bacterium]